MTKKETKDEVAFETVDDVLSYLQRSLHVPKSQFNKFGNYHYRNAEDILNAVKKGLPEGATIIVKDDMFELGGRIYVKATATIRWGGQEVSGQAFAREEESKKGMDSSQVTGATSSYARKYALNGLLCIDDVKDADSGADEPNFKNSAARNNYTKALIASIEATENLETLDEVFLEQKDKLIKMREGDEYDVLAYDEITKRYKAHKDALKFIAEQSELTGVK